MDTPRDTLPGPRKVAAHAQTYRAKSKGGLVRMERAIKERMSISQEIDTLMPTSSTRSRSPRW
jgi:hypothetical protein